MKVQFLRHLNALMKAHRIPHATATFETQCQGLFKFCITVQYHAR